MRRFAWFCSALLMLSAQPVCAGLELQWNACSGALDGTDDIDFRCDDPATIHRLYGSFRSDFRMHRAIAIDGMIDFFPTRDDSIPRFWNYDLGECNEGGICFTFDNPVPPSCGPAPWASDGSEFGWRYTSRFHVPYQARMVFTIFRDVDDGIPISPDTTYFAFEIEFRMAKGQCCAGCDRSLQITWTEAILSGFDEDGALIEQSIQGGGDGASNCVGANKGHCGVHEAVSAGFPAPDLPLIDFSCTQTEPCGATAVKNRTWGRIKAFYR